MKAATFNLGIDQFVNEDIPNAASVLMRTVAGQLLQGLVLKTPVDTGRARGNWIVTVETIDLTFSEATDRSGGETISRGMAVIDAAAANPFRSIFIQNNLPYIERLEDGHSKQAPGGMLTVTLAEVESQFV